jgi:hypothetical protein
MTQIIYRVTGKDRMSDPWITEDFTEKTEAEAWAARRAFLRPADTAKHDILAMFVSER